MSHDLTYFHSEDLCSRHKADEIIATTANKRMRAKYSRIKEKVAIFVVKKRHDPKT